MSSGMKPQRGEATEHSCGGFAKLTGGVSNGCAAETNDDGQVAQHPGHLGRYP